PQAVGTRRERLAQTRRRCCANPGNHVGEAHAGRRAVAIAFPLPPEKGGGRTRRRTALSLRATGCEVHPLRPAASGSKAPRASGIRRNGTTQRGTSRCARRDLHRNAAAGYLLRATTA